MRRTLPPSPCERSMTPRAPGTPGAKCEPSMPVSSRRSWKRLLTISVPRSCRTRVTPPSVFTSRSIRRSRDTASAAICALFCTGTHQPYPVKTSAAASQYRDKCGRPKAVSTNCVSIAMICPRRVGCTYSGAAFMSLVAIPLASSQIVHLFWIRAAGTFRRLGIPGIMPALLIASNI